ncbi:MAG TPA: YrhB domain-containing protein [Pseudolysinimonas sp.]
MGSTRPIRLLDDVAELPGHWVFYYNDSRFLDSEDSAFDMVNSGPIAISKDDGSLTYLHGAEPADDQLRGV